MEMEVDGSVNPGSSLALSVSNRAIITVRKKMTLRDPSDAHLISKEVEGSTNHQKRRLPRAPSTRTAAAYRTLAEHGSGPSKN